MREDLVLGRICVLDLVLVSGISNGVLVSAYQIWY